MAVVDARLLGTRGCLHLCESFPKKNFLGCELTHSSRVDGKNNIIGVLVFHTRGNGFRWECLALHGNGEWNSKEDHVSNRTKGNAIVLKILTIFVLRVFAKPH